MKAFFAKRKTRPRRKRENPKREMSFLEHLDELRGRLIICFVSIVLTTIGGGVFFAKPMLDALTRPFNVARNVMKEDMLVLRIAKDGSVHALNRQDWADGNLTKSLVKIQGTGVPQDREIVLGPGTGEGLISTTLFAPLILLIKAAIILGIIFAVPIWLWQIWLFVAPAMTTRERQVVRPVLLSGIFLFPLGAAFAYGMLNFIMPVLLQYAKVISGVQLLPDIQKYVSFALNLMLAFGLIFETPLVLVMVVRMGLISTEVLRKSRPYMVVGVFVLAAVLTPSTDPFTLFAMALPMLILFEISMWVAWVVERKVKAAEGE
ncbi:MAG: twin-arginine translocase subunit TatC [Candidatus Sumerlaeia bacterium]|nr:twin-arginine translocase subunit TatC [Candidatus Sumerlaeia bacterium]